MKNYIKTTALIVAVSLAQVACEKDQTTPKSYDNIHQDKSKQTYNTNKSIDNSDLYIHIVDYATDLEDGVVPQDLDWEKGMLSVESAVNYNLGKLGETSMHSEIVEISVNAEASLVDNTYKLNGEDALSFYNNLKSDINDAYLESDLYTNYGSDVFISVIDLTFSDSPSSSGLVEIGALISFKYKPEPAFPFCDIENDWKALDLLGRCVNGNYDNTDAAVRIETYLTHLDCNELWYLKAVNCNPALWGVASAFEDGFNTTNVWNGQSVSDCISSLAISNTWIPGALTEADVINPSPGYLNEVDYSVGKAVNQLNGDVAHKLTVSYAVILCYAYDPV